MGVPQIEMRDVGLSYFSPKHETEALRDIRLEVKAGEFISIVGPSGCGKSTLLSLVSGMLKPTRGEVLLMGERVNGVSPRVGYMLQHDHLFEWRDVLSNLLVGAEVRRIDKKKAKEKALYLLERYGLGGFAHHSPSQLSGGMRQRVALVRTLVAEPDILLLDEPFSALDFQTRLTLADDVHHIIKEQGKTAILVTHDIPEAITMADRVLVMSKRPSTFSASYDIVFDEGPDLTPWRKREAGRFQEYFNGIWKELDAHVASAG
ncbi:NitT/TauT family transport system ATP-binding protein [Cohnella thailandensis]|uniref:ABC transporter ATP-binding protein n=1 Tax=Cohnella thailandensis TaxID=557557 RepID=A0A841SVA7_9BACL|nr:ABC transporter ATP-binding protein [Cohnella thailandensis]MBB6635192.1 ABC transporter ATP-binding protein [Cohnella thailandensis]MBP1974342.1 NitT/TauT family transport system ATP-binding protein [Cohnella thailandensis]